MNIRDIIETKRDFCREHIKCGGECTDCVFNYDLDGITCDCNDGAIDRYIKAPNVFFSMIRWKNISIKNISMKVE